jgi:N6-adenosine-specific RNA methylase IME4
MAATLYIPYRIMSMAATLYIPYRIISMAATLYIPYRIMSMAATLYIPYRIMSMAATLFILYSWYNIRFSRRWLNAFSFEIKPRVVWHKPAFREQPVAYILTLEVSSPKQTVAKFTPHGR